MDDLIERLRQYAQADDLHKDERDTLIAAADALDDYENASKHSADDLRARDARIAELEQALEAAREDAWQPIETAPRDGTEVIVRCYGAATEFVHIAWYRSKDAWEESGKFCGGWDSLEDWLGWWSYVRTSVSQEKLEGWHTPTHWRPLPAQPAIDQARGKEAHND